MPFLACGRYVSTTQRDTQRQQLSSIENPEVRIPYYRAYQPQDAIY